MKVFHCDHCRQLVFFENSECTHCGHLLAYLPDLNAMAALDPAGDGSWTSPWPKAAGRHYRLCANYTQHGICNWTVPAADPDALCRSCRLTEIIPNLERPGSKVHWQKLEAAKRRLIYSLVTLNLPICSRAEDAANGLAFNFVADADNPDDTPVLTGHNEGLITVNIAEADDAERERRRLQLHEPYRTLLGHLRHESGHYYWDRLIRDSTRIDVFRSVFGDERADYEQALKAHYAQRGPPADWQQRFASAYATTHPWEDWAESWAHYLHMTDTLEIAAACGLSMNPPREEDPQLSQAPTLAASGQAGFDVLINAWFPVTYLLNNLNRGLGVADAYPFVLSPPAVDKLRFVHDTIAGPRPAASAA